MSNQWLRLWHDMPTDPKWRTVARVSKQPITNVIAVYVHMLVCASNATERGRTQGWNDEDVASALDLETSDVIAIRETMQGRVLEGDYLSGWEKRQPKREDDSALRAKEWRERQRLERERTQANAEKRPEEDTDTETDKKDPVVADRGRVAEIFRWLEEFLNSPTPLFSSPVAAWLSWGADFDLDIKPVAERWRKAHPRKAIRSLEWLDDDIAASIEKRGKAMPSNHLKGQNNGDDSKSFSANRNRYAGDGGGNKTDRAKAAIIRAAVAGGYATAPGQQGEAGTGDDSLPVLSGA